MFWKNFLNLFSSTVEPVSPESKHHPPDINPASGLPMAGNHMGGVDIAGNLYGTNQQNDSFSAPQSYQPPFD